MDDPICASAGPRIGDDGHPYCWRALHHRGPHKPHPDQGWGNLSWGDPVMARLSVRVSAAFFGLRPYRCRYVWPAA
jgi:hypothetical protein